jgi:hypothetical protein
LDQDEKNEFYSIRDEVKPQGFMLKIMQRRGELLLHSENPDLPGPDTLMAQFGSPAGIANGCIVLKSKAPAEPYPPLT